MAGALTLYARNKLVEHSLGLTAWTMPTNVYMGLFTADPTDAGLLTNELPNQDNYARVNLATLLGTASNGTVTNIANILFNTPTIDWGSVTHLGLIDSPTHGSGNMLYAQELLNPIIVTVADPALFEIGLFSVTLD